MHVGFVYLLISYILGWFSFGRHGNIAKAIMAIVLIWAYAVLTGLAPAVCRASFMLSLGIAGYTFNSHINRLNLLAVTAFVLLLANPLLINDVGFRLSFTAVFGITLLQAPVYKIFNPQNPILKKIWLAASVAIAAQAVLWPLSLFYFHQFPVLFLLSNLLVLIPAAIVMYAGMLLLVLPQLPIISAGLGLLIKHTIGIMNHILGFIENTPYTAIQKIWLSPAEVLLCYLLIASLVLLYFGRKRAYLWLSYALAFILTTETCFKMVSTYQNNSFMVFSLNNKEAILFKNGHNGVLLTNLSDTDKTYPYAIQPAVDSLMIRHLDRIHFSDDLRTAFFVKKANLLQYHNLTMLVFDKAMANKHLLTKINTNYIYLYNNAQTNLPYLKQNYSFKTLIAGCGNKPNTVNELQKQAETNKTDFVRMHGNKAYLAASN